jgi:hypothetical protein
MASGDTGKGKFDQVRLLHEIQILMLRLMVLSGLHQWR